MLLQIKFVLISLNVDIKHINYFSPSTGQLPFCVHAIIKQLYTRRGCSYYKNILLSWRLCHQSPLWVNLYLSLFSFLYLIFLLLVRLCRCVDYFPLPLIILLSLSLQLALSGLFPQPYPFLLLAKKLNRR